jgi:hypothetical protein
MDDASRVTLPRRAEYSACVMYQRLINLIFHDAASRVWPVEQQPVRRNVWRFIVNHKLFTLSSTSHRITEYLARTNLKEYFQWFELNEYFILRSARRDFNYHLKMAWFTAFGAVYIKRIRMCKKIYAFSQHPCSREVITCPSIGH